jgi:hypothetical protein
VQQPCELPPLTNRRLNAFPNTLYGTQDFDQMENLISVTHFIGEYRLIFKQGEPFKPVSLRVHDDPISIIGNVLDQNTGSYTKIADFVDIGKRMVKAGLVARGPDGKCTLNPEQLKEQESISQLRVVSMCIDAALSEDDFETAYSYVVTRLKDIAGPAQVRSPEVEMGNSGLVAEPLPQAVDEWSWLAAFQAGKYRRSGRTVRPSHLGNASGNPEIRHLEQRMDCLGQALRIAPKATLHAILNVYRRCEEELETLTKQEAEQEDAWDAQGDEQTMPGGYKPTPMKKSVTGPTSRRTEEAPMSLFDLSRASMARAQTGLSGLSMLRGKDEQGQHNSESTPRGSEDISRVATPDSSGKGPMRKRDQLKNAAVGGLASGIGWLINAPPVAHQSNEEREE